MPLPPELMVMLPIALLDMVFELELKSRIPKTGVVLAVVEVAAMTIVEEPSRLPMALPVTLPTLNRPPVVPRAMAVKHELSVFVELRAEVWLMPEMMFPWTLVGVVVLTFARSSPRNSFPDPLIVVVPVPSAAPKPIIFPVTVKKSPLESIVIPAYRWFAAVNVLGAVW